MPSTEAGRRLVPHIDPTIGLDGPEGWVLAIEAEAAAAERVRILAG